MTRKRRVLRLLQDAAARAVGAGDPWARHRLELLPAERIRRHLYHPAAEAWTEDETIVKVEREPFTHGAMRSCYRMKKRAQPPASATNHRFHKLGWSYASNYVAKAYVTDGEVDCSEKAKRAVRNDILLQYEAQHWAEKFNEANPPSRIHFIRAYAIEFPDRPGKPWFAVERFITGTDSYGHSFVKHNTNAGFVDADLRRVTPQVFSAHSFYASQGRRLVADIQGVGDLYTDPQVLSSDYRFGDGDLGPRGMALFFKSFRHCGMSDSLGIPIFPLSKNEIKCQLKYEEDEVTVSDEEESLPGDYPPPDAFQRLDLNRRRRSLALKSPQEALPLDRRDTFRRSNVTSGYDRGSVSDLLRRSLGAASSAVRTPRFHRSKSDVDEVLSCLDRAEKDLVFTHHDYHRKASGELRQRQYRSQEDTFHKSAKVRTVSAPMEITEETRKNLGRVHFQMAVLHGMGRFPEVVPAPVGSDPADDDELPAHDSFSVLFHLSYAAALKNAPACLSMARVRAGLDSTVSNLLLSIVPTDFSAAETLLRRAMTSPYPPSKPKAAAGCLLFQILHDKRNMLDTSGEENGGATTSTDSQIMMEVLEETLSLLKDVSKEESEAKIHKKTVERGGGFHAGDRVEANFALEGTYYAATVDSLSDDGEQITVCYDDDGSSETLSKEHVRFLIPPTATQTTTGGPLSDEEAFGAKEGGDDRFLLPAYELQADLAKLKAAAGDTETASFLFEQAADSAMANGKMKTATEWSLRAAELR
jgi:elongation factor 2 kinase